MNINRNVSHAPISVECLFSMTLLLGLIAQAIATNPNGRD